ncbi:DUF6538 domain-containing protein [Klebsiella variicola]|uniref:DUF6538 domain-containing protein n=1 Tax=Klebsiella variicola TaxID=244366 RepID=UPI0011596012|nr:DUF6538 domain-containing protein [Klebsiella variicola]
MGIMIKPTKDRNGTYYIRKAVPQELRPTIGKGELKLSLKTKDLGQAKLKAPAALAEINSIIQNAKAERSVTQDDTEVIASVWMTRILQQPETIKARYVRQYDYGYGLTADNVQLSKCLRKGEQADEADFQLVTQLMQSELEEALRWTPAVLTPAWRQKLAWRLAEYRLSTAEMYIIDELPVYTAINATQQKKSMTFASLFEHYKAHIRLTDKDRAESRIRDYTPSANRFIKFIGDKPIRDISKSDLAAFRTLLELTPANRSKAVNLLSLENQAKAQGKKLSANTVRNNFMHLSAMFTVALQDDLVDEHPFDSFKMRKKVQTINEDIPFGASAARPLFNACGVSPSSGTTYSENPAYGWVFAFLRPISVGFYHAVSSVPLRPIPHRIFSKIHFQISDNTLIKIAIFSPKAAKNALFWQSIRPGGYPAFPPDGQIASYIPFDANSQRNVL